MKFLVLAGAFLFISLNTHASSAENSKSTGLDDTLHRFMEYASNANDWLANDGYYLLFGPLYPGDFHEYSNGKCLRDNNYKDIEKEMLIMAMQKPLLVAYTHLLGLLREGILTQEEFDNINKTYPDTSGLSQQLAPFDLKTCTEKITPNSPDGDAITFVKLNSYESFLFGLGIEKE